MTYGLGIYALMGASVNFPQAPSNPILNAAGPIYASAAALGIQPAVSVQLTEKLSVGGGPIIGSMTMGLNPAFFAPNGGGGFPVATPGRPFWGAGFQFGMLYEPNCCWSLGCSYKSPIWFETFKYNAQDASANPREVHLDLTLPEILSFGVAYHGFERATFAMDVRYLNYADTVLFGAPLPAPGLNWDSIYSLAIGVEYQLTDRVTTRRGYLVNENPIPEVLTLFNMQLPAITQHQLSFGGSLQMTCAITMDMARQWGWRWILFPPRSVCDSTTNSSQRRI